MPKDNGPISAERLKAFITRIERVQEDVDASVSDRKEIYDEAKGVGYDAAIIRKIVTLRKKEIEKRREEQELLDLYMSSIGMDN